MNLAIFNFTDEVGNQLRCNPETGALTLQLANEARVRQIGHIKQGRNTFYYEKMEEHVHIFRKTNSWGLHWHIIDNLPEDSGVVLVTSEKTYWIKKQDAIQEGSFLWFKNQGLEKRFFVPLEHWRTC